jgi:hypothetical protein
VVAVSLLLLELSGCCLVASICFRRCFIAIVWLLSVVLVAGWLEPCACVAPK